MAYNDPKSLINTRIAHKRGVYSEAIINRLKDGELFYDIAGEQGIWMGVAKGNTIVPVQLATVGGSGSGTISPEDLADLVKKTDIKVVTSDGTYLDTDVASANSVKTLAATVVSNKSQVEALVNTVNALQLALDGDGTTANPGLKQRVSDLELLGSDIISDEVKEYLEEKLKLSQVNAGAVTFQVTENNTYESKIESNGTLETTITTDETTGKTTTQTGTSWVQYDEPTDASDDDDEDVEGEGF